MTSVKKPRKVEESQLHRNRTSEAGGSERVYHDELTNSPLSGTVDFPISLDCDDKPLFYRQSSPVELQLDCDAVDSGSKNAILREEISTKPRPRLRLPPAPLPALVCPPVASKPPVISKEPECLGNIFDDQISELDAWLQSSAVEGNE